MHLLLVANFSAFIILDAANPTDITTIGNWKLTRSMVSPGLYSYRLWHSSSLYSSPLVQFQVRTKCYGKRKNNDCSHYHVVFRYSCLVLC